MKEMLQQITGLPWDKLLDLAESILEALWWLCLVMIPFLIYLMYDRIAAFRAETKKMLAQMDSRLAVMQEVAQRQIEAAKAADNAAYNAQFQKP